MAVKFQSVEEYLLSLPPEARQVAEKMRAIIRRAVPEAEELISYNMPAYKAAGVVVYFAAWKNHIGLYPLPSGILAFEQALKDYAVSKGAIQFPFSKPLPESLIAEIARFRFKENQVKASARKK